MVARRAQPRSQQAHGSPSRVSRTFLVDPPDNEDAQAAAAKKTQPTSDEKTFMLAAYAVAKARKP